MAYKLDNVTTYVEQNGDVLLTNVEIGGKAFDMFQLMTDVKGDTLVHNVTLTAPLQDAKTCGFTPSGDDTFGEATIKAAPLKVNKEWCAKDLLGKFAQHQVRVTAGRETLPFEEMFINGVVAETQNNIENIIWNGGVNITGIIPALTTATAITGSTAWEKLWSLYQQLPANSADKYAVYASSAQFRAVVAAMVEKNLYHYDVGMDVENGYEYIYFPGTNMRVYNITNMQGDNMYAFRADMVYIGVSASEDTDTFKFWHSDDNDTFRMNIQFVLGVAVLPHDTYKL